MLETVVSGEHGTGHRAAVDGYQRRRQDRDGPQAQRRRPRLLGRVRRHLRRVRAGRRPAARRRRHGRRARAGLLRRDRRRAGVLRGHGGRRSPAAACCPTAAPAASRTLEDARRPRAEAAGRREAAEVPASTGDGRSARRRRGDRAAAPGARDGRTGRYAAGRAERRARRCRRYAPPQPARAADLRPVPHRRSATARSSPCPPPCPPSPRRCRARSGRVATSRWSTRPTTRGRSGPGGCSAASSGASADGHDHAPARSTPGRGRAARRAVARPAGRRRSRSRRSAPPPGPPPRPSTGDPSERPDGRRRHRDQRQDHHDRAARGRVRGRGPGDRRDRHRRDPHPRRGRARACARPPRAPDLQRLLRTHARPRRRRGRDGGVLARARPAPRRRHPVRRRAVHQPLAGPPRLPRHRWTPTSPPRRGCSPRSCPTAGSCTSTARGGDGGCATVADDPGHDLRGRRRRRPPRRADCVTGIDGGRAVVVGPDGRAARGPDRACSATFNVVERGRGRARRGGRRRPAPDAAVAGVAAATGPAGPRRAGRRRAALHRARRLRPHPGRARRASIEAVRGVLDDRRARPRRVGCGGDRDRGKRPAMGAAAAAADVAVLTSDNPRTRGPGAILGRRRGRRPRRGRGRRRRPTLHVEVDRRAAIALGARRAPHRGTSSLVAGKGHETGQELADRTVPVRRPRGRPRAAAGGRRVRDRLTLARAVADATGGRVVGDGRPRIIDADRHRFPGRCPTARRCSSPCAASTAPTATLRRRRAAARRRAALVERRRRPTRRRRVVVDDTWRALRRPRRPTSAAASRRRAVAITGSVGKTTVKDLTAAAVGAQPTVSPPHAARSTTSSASRSPCWPRATATRCWSPRSAPDTSATSPTSRRSSRPTSPS